MKMENRFPLNFHKEIILLFLERNSCWKKILKNIMNIQLVWNEAK